MPRQLKLTDFTPTTFLEAYNAGVGARLIEMGATSGELALRNDISTLGDVSEVLGSRSAIDWLILQVYRLEEAGAVTLSTDAKEQNRLRRETAQMIYAKYKELNLAELSLFFARFLAAEYDEATKLSIGAMKIYVALQAYMHIRQADMRRVERERETREFLARWEENRAKAITREEYLRQKNEEL